MDLSIYIYGMECKKMERFLVYTGTVTYALKAKDLLLRLGYKARIERRTKDIGKYGCGYLVVVETDDINKVKSVLLSGKVKILKTEKAAAL